MTAIQGTGTTREFANVDLQRTVGSEAQETIDLCNAIINNPDARPHQIAQAEEILQNAQLALDGFRNGTVSVNEEIHATLTTDGAAATTLRRLSEKADQFATNTIAYLDAGEQGLYDASSNLLGDPPAAATGPDATGNADPSASTEVTAGTPKFDEMMSDPDALLDMYNDSPEAFTEFYKGLSSDDKQMLMTRLNQEMQQSNQMYSLISNLLQASHQTARAVIQNLRV